MTRLKLQRTALSNLRRHWQDALQTGTVWILPEDLGPQSVARQHAEDDRKAIGASVDCCVEASPIVVDPDDERRQASLQMREGFRNGQPDASDQALIGHVHRPVPSQGVRLGSPEVSGKHQLSMSIGSIEQIVVNEGEPT